MQPFLEVTDLQIQLHVPVSVGSFTLKPGELLWITGPNGAGKSTLIQVLLGATKKKRGRVEWNISTRSIQYVPQLANSGFALPISLGDVLNMQAPFEHEEPRLLDPNQMQLAWNTASGGERKRALLERAMRKNPHVLVLDEPLNHLDRASRDAIVSALAAFLSRGEGAVIAVSHDPWPDAKFKDITIRKLELK